MKTVGNKISSNVTLFTVRF